MIGAELKIESFNPRAIEQPLERAIHKNIPHAAASIRKRAIESIKVGTGPSPPGTPPHTHTARIIKRGKNKGKTRMGQLPRSIVYAYDAKAQEAVIGPRFSVVGTSGKAHEFGGPYKDDTYPERPFMGPSLQQNLDRFAASFAGSMGG